MKKLLVITIIFFCFSNLYSQINSDANYFIANKGQWPEKVLFLFRTHGVDYWILRDGFLINQFAHEWSNSEGSTEFNSRGYISEFIWEDSGFKDSLSGEKLAGKFNFILSDNESENFTNITLYKDVILHNLYNNIDVRYYIENGKFRYDLILKPNSNEEDVKLAFDDLKSEATSEGEIYFFNDFAKLVHTRPKSFQNIDGHAVEVYSSVNVQNGVMKLKFGSYDKNRELIFDPIIYSTYFGGQTSTNPIAIDLSDSSLPEIFISGITTSLSFPLTTGAYDNTLNGTGNCSGICSQNIFVSKFNQTGEDLIYSTIVGGNFSNGSLNDYLYDLDVQDGNAIITGRYQSNFPLTASSGGYSFLTKLNYSGDGLIFSVGWGGFGTNSMGIDVEHDSEGNVVLLGKTNGNSISLTQNSFNFQNLSPLFYGYFIAKFNQIGQNQFSTVINGTSYRGHLQIDNVNNIYVVVETDLGLGGVPISYSSSSFDANYNQIPGCSQSSSSSCTSDIQYLKLSSNGIQLLGGTYIGGIGEDYPCGFSIDENGDVLILCKSNSVDFPQLDVTSNSWRNILIKIDNSGNNLLHAEIWNKSDPEKLIPFGGNSSLLYGNISSSDSFLGMYLTANAIQNIINGDLDNHFIIIDNSDLSVLYNTYLGGQANDGVIEYAVNDLGCLGALGSTNSSDLFTPMAYDVSLDLVGGVTFTDCFVMSVCNLFNTVPAIILPDTVCSLEQFTVNNMTVSNSECQEVFYEWIIIPNVSGVSFENGTNSFSQNPTIQLTQPGNYNVTAVINSCGSVAYWSQQIQVLELEEYFIDLDFDGFGGDDTHYSCFLQKGYVLNNLDCNDSNPNMFPLATEICNGIDDNCNTQIDEGFDTDTDSFTICSGDCDDSNLLIYPGAPEVLDLLDNNCDGQIDEGLSPDSDGDGFTVVDGDCDDNNASVNPNATELCNGIDDNCNTQVDEGFDTDADSFTICNGDCDDTNALIYPGAPEILDLLDNNCDGQIDEGLSPDADGDGFTVADGDCDDNNANVYPNATEICNGIDDNCNTQVDEGFDLDTDTFTSCNGDCDDTNALIYPGAPEVLDSLDNNCDGQIDEGFNPDPDADGDGFSLSEGDCNDADPNINPGATELCNGIDDNCNSMIDEGFDLDGDGETSCEGDCNDNDSLVNTSAIELCNSIDDNCDTFINEGLACDELTIQIPNGISPNGDGFNDAWYLPWLNGMTDYSIVISNRWGQVIFQTNDYSSPWDGTYLGNPLPAADYFYVIKLSDNTTYEGVISIKY